MGTNARRVAAVGACLAASALGLIACGARPHAVVRSAAPAGVVNAVTPEPPAPPAPTADEVPTPEPGPVAVAAVVRARPAPVRLAVVPARPRPRQDGLFTIEIPRLGLVARVHDGQSAAVLARGPGHTPGSAMPGENGNVVIPGHRTVSPHPFQNIDQLRPGDTIVLVADNGRFVYQVTGSTIVAAEDGNVAGPTPDPVVTIYACHPKGSDAQRYVVFGRLVSSPADAPAPAKDAGQPPPRPQATPPPANRDQSRPACGLVPCVRR